MVSQTDGNSCLSNDSTKEYVDHRKRRRNRTTLSCLNCHGSKRMCDRKRPSCGRCTKLGLSGTCVYEVDDLNRRDVSRDEIFLLKKRIAELEGFIREFKRKPHPRTVTRRKRSTSGASTPCSEDSDSVLRLPTSPDTSRNESSSESDNDIHTPALQEETPVFLHGFSSPSPSINQSVGSSGPQESDMNSVMDIDSTFNFTSDGLFSDDNGTLERIFSRIMEQEARDLHKSRNCRCVKESSSLSAILELAPHLHRALNVLHSVPEHHTQVTDFGSPCYYLNQLQSLTDTVTSVIESSQDTNSSSTPPCGQYGQRLSTNQTLPSSTCSDDSPLQRVLAARRAGLVPSPFSEKSAVQTPTADSPRAAWKASAAPTAWEARETPPGSRPSVSDTDSLMSWEVSPRGTWPRTISL